jgi:hypothetical protein
MPVRAAGGRSSSSTAAVVSMFCYWWSVVGGFWHVISWSWLQVQRLGEDEEREEDDNSAKC